MKPYIDKIVEIIIWQTSNPSTITSFDTKTSLDFGYCPNKASYIFKDDDTKLETFLCSCSAHFDMAADAMIGSNPYRLFNNICLSALHAGAIKRWVNSPPVFRGSTQNGIKTEAASQGDSSGAFVVQAAQ